jgi:hypothetical protein
MLQALRVAAFKKCMLGGRRSIPFHTTGKSRLETMASQNLELFVEIT